jgi:hypothetical protein
MNEEPAEFLHKIGVDTRFVSIMDEHIFINNLKFSRFSRRKEELFLRKFPYYEVVRSKLLQKICTRASRVLKNALKPRDKVFIIKDRNCFNLALHIVLEPYTRKYGVKLIFGKSLKDLNVFRADSVALPVTLDDEIENIINSMFNGKKIEPLSLNYKFNGMKVICPFVNVSRSWIISWLEKQDLKCNYKSEESFEKDLINFLEGFIPDVKENMFKSAEFVHKVGLNQADQMDYQTDLSE